LEAGQAWFGQRGGKGIPMADVLAEFGLAPEDFQAELMLNSGDDQSRSCPPTRGYQGLARKMRLTAA
jgi:hypothetical protein